MEPLEPTPEAERNSVAPEQVEAAVAVSRRIADNIRRAVKVTDDVLEHVIVSLLAEGHILVEDYPGVGKTALARALSRSVDCQFARVQCTADLLPADIVGTNVYNQREARFEFRPGPIFANIVIVDEINRASPKTQSGLLECMQERQVTVDATSHELARPFMVFATQNPVEYEGTYPLPEAQVDRFMIRVSLGYPNADEEAGMLAGHEAHDRVLDLEAVADRAEVVEAVEAAHGVHASRALRDYIVALLRHTRADSRVELGASPRAGLMLLRAAKARALVQGRDHALPDDVQALSETVLAHRLMLVPEAAGVERATIVADAIAATPASDGRAHDPHDRAGVAARSPPAEGARGSATVPFAVRRPASTIRRAARPRARPSNDALGARVRGARGAAARRRRHVRRRAAVRDRLGARAARARRRGLDRRRGLGRAGQARAGRQERARGAAARGADPRHRRAACRSRPAGSTSRCCPSRSASAPASSPRACAWTSPSAAAAAAGSRRPRSSCATRSASPSAWSPATAPTRSSCSRACCRCAPPRAAATPRPPTPALR